MNVGVVTTSFPRSSEDFAGNFVAASVDELLEAGHEVEVLAAGDGGRAATTVERGPGRARVVRLSVPASARRGTDLFYSEGAPEILEKGLAASWLQAAGFCAALCVELRERSRTWDEIRAHWLVPCALVAGAVAPHIPVRAFAHSGDIALLERLVGGPSLARWLAAHLAEITFASEDLRRRFGRLVGGAVAARCHTAPAAVRREVAVGGAPRAQGPPAGTASAGWGPAKSSTAAARMAVAAAGSGGFVLSVGRLVPIKGFDVLLRAAALGQAALGAPLPVVILGDGPERLRLEASAVRLGVALRLPGYVPAGDVTAHLRAARLYVQPSRRLPNGRSEGVPVATLEALAAGVPTIVSDSGGLTELGSTPHAGAGRPSGCFRADDHRALARCLVAAHRAEEAGAENQGLREQTP